MRLARLGKLCCLVLASMGCAVAQVQPQTAPPDTAPAASPNQSHFLLEVAGRKVGEADYQVDPTGKGFSLQSTYKFNTNGTMVSCNRQADLTPAYGMVRDFLVVNVVRSDEDAQITVDPDRQHFTYKLKSSVQSVEQRNDLHPGTVVLNNFDPSGMQVLVWMAASHPTPDGTYWALLAQGKGVYMPVKLTAAEPAEGKLKGATLKLKHWTLRIQDTDTDLWADSNNRLMAFVVPSQQTTYRRDGFERGQTEREATPGADAVEERHVFVAANDGVKLPAFLVIPKVLRGPVPIVVMVAGSGPQDADETIGPNKPFRDIAYGLGAAGIASLRYDQRARVDPETSTRDVAAAVRFAAEVPEANPREVFVLGHGLGGTMAPGIVAHTPKIGTGSVHGLILLAAGAGSTEDPAGWLRKLNKPALNLRGSKDIQASQEDFIKLQDANYYPGSLGEQISGLNHLMMPVTGDSTGEEYMKPGHVSPEVIGAIANWIASVM